MEYVARMETSCGLITIDLLEGDAPVAVNSFVFLANEGFYDGSRSSATSEGSLRSRPAAVTTPSGGTSATCSPMSWTSRRARVIRSGR